MLKILTEGSESKKLSVSDQNLRHMRRRKPVENMLAYQKLLQAFRIV